MGMSASGTGAVLPPVGSKDQPPLSGKPSPAACAVAEKGEGQWLVVGKGRGKCQAAGPQSPEGPRTKGTNSPTPFINVKGDAPASPKRTTEASPKRLTEARKNPEPSADKIEKIKKLKEKLDNQKRSQKPSEKIVTSSTPSPSSPDKSSSSIPSSPVPKMKISPAPPSKLPPLSRDPSPFRTLYTPDHTPCPSPSLTPSPSPSPSPRKSEMPPPSKRPRSPSAEALERRKKRNSLPYQSGEDVCRISPAQAERCKAYGNRIKELRYLLSAKHINDQNIEDPRNFPKAQRVLTVIRLGTGTRQPWAMVEEALKSFKNIMPPLAIIENDLLNKLKQFCSGRAPVLVHPSLYRALKLTFPWDVGGLSADGSVKNEMGQGSMGEAVGILSPSMFKPASQP